MKNRYSLTNILDLYILEILGWVTYRLKIDFDRPPSPSPIRWCNFNLGTVRAIQGSVWYFGVTIVRSETLKASIKIFVCFSIPYFLLQITPKIKILCMNLYFQQKKILSKPLVLLMLDSLYIFITSRCLSSQFSYKYKFINMHPII